MKTRMFAWLACAVCCFPHSAWAADLEWYKWRDVEGMSFGGFIAGMQAIKVLDDGQTRRIVYGDRHGRVRVVEWRNGRFQEVWSSPALRGAISEVFVADINANGDLDIVAYTEQGDIAFYSAKDYKLLWRSTDDQFASISAMTIANIDDDPQLELIFCAEEAADVAGYRASGSRDNIEQERSQQIGRLFVFDCRNLFVEWRTEKGIWGHSIAVGDLDGDGNKEIVINTGFVIDARYQSVQWEYRDGFGDRIGFVDLDGDGTPELVGEFRSSTRPRRFLRVFDVDLQSESFLSSGR